MTNNRQMNQAAASHVEMPTRASHLWLKREDDLLFNICMGMHEDLSVLDLAARMSRCPMDVARHVLDGEVPDMIGFSAEPGSEEEAEFLGLALSGVPLQASLQWCTASEGRPTSAQLQEMMAGPDMRPALSVAVSAGVWLSGMVNIQALTFLANQPLGDVVNAAQAALDRFDAPTPTVVAQQMLGLFAQAQPAYPWMSDSNCSNSTTQGGRGYRATRGTSGTAGKATASTAKTRQSKSRAGSGKSKFSSDAARRKYWAKRNAKRKIGA